MSMQLKSNFAVEKKYEAFYTGGKVQISSDGEYLCCQCGTKVNMLKVQSGQVQHTLEKDDDEVTNFCLSPDDNMLVIAGKSLLLRQWDWRNNTITRTWKAIHIAPVSCMTFDPTSTLLATGGSDSTIKIWDVIRQYCTHNLKGHQGVVTAVEFHPDILLLQLITAAEDYKIRIWDLQKSQCLSVLDGHFSNITSLQIDSYNHLLYSGGRDKVIITWDLDTYKKSNLVPVYESVEGLILLPKEQEFEDLGVKTALSQQHYVSAGSSGSLKVWNAVTGKNVHKQKLKDAGRPSLEHGNEGPTQHSIVNAFTCPANGIVTTVTYEHNIILHTLQDFSVHRQFVGYNDDILDIKFAGEKDSHIAVTTNSSLVKVFNVETWDCQILHGHNDIVLCIDAYKDGMMLITGSKDNNVILWQMDNSGKIHQVAAGYGHTHAVAAVAFSRLGTSFVVSGSQDCTIKLWPLPSHLTVGGPFTKLQAKATEKAHDKDINAITVAPNDKFLATGSQDRTSKLWSIPGLSLLGVFRGHKRGIWCVQFSPVDQCLATSSADGTLKLWGLTDFSCLKTFEGHESSVLNVCFVQSGMQLVSSGSDGLLKLWTLKTNECVKTFDAHDEKIWALAVNQKEDLVVTGAGDSKIIFWKDVTETEIEEARVKQHDLILKEQQLSNLLQQKKYLKAICLAITLDQPFRVLGILKDVLGEPDGADQLKETLLKLREDQLDAILMYSVRWNMNSKHCHAAQFVLNVLLTEYTADDLIKLPNFKSSLEAVLPYTERHFQRMNRLQQQSTFVDYTWQSMKLVDQVRGESDAKEIVDTASVPRHNTMVEARAQDSDSDLSDTDNEGSASEEADISKKKEDLPVMSRVPDLHSDGQHMACSDEELEKETKNLNLPHKENTTTSKAANLLAEKTEKDLSKMKGKPIKSTSPAGIKGKKKKVPTATLR